MIWIEIILLSVTAGATLFLINKSDNIRLRNLYYLIFTIIFTILITIAVGFQARIDTSRIISGYIVPCIIFSVILCSEAILISIGIRKFTNTMAEALPIRQRYQKILEELAKGCRAIPTGLCEAARNCLNKKGADAKKTLITAAASYFSSACVPENPGIPASNLLHICKKGDFPQGEFSSMLENIDAATYLYGKALKKEFEKAGIYEPHGKRLLSNFFLSNAVLREPIEEK